MIKFLNLIFCVIAVLIFSADCSAQWGLTRTEVQSEAHGRIINLLDPNSNLFINTFAGLLNGRVDENPAQFYTTRVGPELIFPDTSFSDSELFGGDRYFIFTYIINNHYPYKPSYPGILENINDECSAIQIALWNLADSLNLNSLSNELIKNRALSIVNDAIINSTNTPFPRTLEIVSDIDPEFFKVKTTDESGNGISVNNIELLLKFSEGYLSTNNVNTVNGYSPPVEIIDSGVGLIFATGNCLFPQGFHFSSRNSLFNTGLLLAKPVTGRMMVSYDWGTLPVELLSFTYSINKKDLSLHWTTSSEINNSGFEIERLESGIERKSVWNRAGFVKGNGNTSSAVSYVFTDKDLPPGKYNYRLKQIDFNGNFEYFDLTGEAVIGYPQKFYLSQNYPNPFNPSSKIEYDLMASDFISLKVYDILGNEISVLVNQYQGAGSYTVNFNGSDLPGGTYFYKLQTETFSEIKKMTLLK